MTKEDFFAQAKMTVFGLPPSCPLALVGHNLAVNYFTPLIWEAESVLQDIAKPSAHFATYLENAFEFASYGAFRKFPTESLSALKRCSDNFRARYEPLAKRNIA